MKTPTYRIIITGGHLAPALAVIEELKLHKRWQIYFVGRDRPSMTAADKSVEAVIIPQLDIPFYPLTAAKLPRRFSLPAFASLLNFPTALYQSLRLIDQIRPHTVLSFGGYVGLPICLAAALRRVPFIIHEQTATAGLTNRILARLARHVAVSWPVAYPFPRPKMVLTGNPVRRELLHPKLSHTGLSLNPSLPTLLIVGGNQGSHAINITVMPLLRNLLKRANVIFQTGTVNLYHDFETASSVTPPPHAGKLIVQKHLFTQQYGAIFNLADLIIGRAGANTVTDIAACGKPALFIPLPWAADNEQFKNAQLLLAKGSKIIPQNELSPLRLETEISQALINLRQLCRQARLAKSLVNPNAATEIVKLLSSLVHEPPIN